MKKTDEAIELGFDSNGNILFPFEGDGQMFSKDETLRQMALAAAMDQFNHTDAGIIGADEIIADAEKYLKFLKA